MALSADQLNTIYNNVLFRNVDQGGIQFFANRTDISDAQVRQQIELSAEASTFVSPIVRLYQEVLGRVPDVQGLRFFSAQLRGGTSLDSIAQSLIGSTEFSNKTAGTGIVDSGDFSNTNQLVTDAFTSILGRQPAASEFAFFQGRSPAQILAGVAGSSEATQTNAAAVVTFLDSAAVGSPNTGSLNNQTGAGTGGTGTGTNAGQTFTLTANTDGPGAPSPATNTTGTSGNDTYNAASGTLNSADSIDGGAGTDTLNYRITGGGENVAPVLNNVENVVVSNISGAASTLNLASATGVTSLIERGSTLGSISNYTNVGSSVLLGLDAAKGTEFFSISGASSRTGNADILSVNVANGTGAANNFNQLNIGTAAGAGGVPAAAPDNSFEVLRIGTSGAASYVNLATGGTNISTVTVTGSGTAATTGATKGYALSLTETANFANVKTIDASGMTGTGGLNISTTLAQDVTFTGSGANDRLNVTAGVASITVADKFAFGAGTDTLAIGTDTAETGYTAGQLQSINAATGLERIEFTQAAFTALKANDFTSVNAFEFSGGGTSALAITGVESVDTYAFSASHVGNVNFTGSAVAQAANIIETGGVALSGVAGAAQACGAGAAGASAISFVSNITTLSLNSTGATANSIVGGAGFNAAAGVNTGGNGGAAIDNGTAVQSVSITGDQNLTISGGNGGAASGADPAAAGFQAGGAAGNGFTGAVSVDATTFTGKLSIVGSAGNDIIKLGVATTGDTTLTGNFVRGGAGADQITLNTGIDRLDYRTASDSIAATFDTVTNFTSGTDKFIVGVTVTGVGAASVNGTGTLATDLTAALSANAGNGFGAGNNASVVTITGGTDAGVYAVVNTNTTGGGNAGYDAADLVVKLVGTTALATADFTQTVTA